MKRTRYKNILFLIFLAAVCFISGGANAAGTQSAAGGLAPNDQPAYDVPEAKQQQWLSAQTLVQKEFDSCKEDCGNDSTCLKRCEEVSKVRLDREYKKLMAE